MTTNDPSKDELESVIDQLDGEQWDVSDWNYTSGMYDTPTLELELEYDPESQTDRADVLEAVERLDEDYDRGVPEDVVMDETNAAAGTLKELKRLGEVYEPRDGHLRRT